MKDAFNCDAVSFIEIVIKFSGGEIFANLEVKLYWKIVPFCFYQCVNGFLEESCFACLSWGEKDDVAAEFDTFYEIIVFFFLKTT